MRLSLSVAYERVVLDHPVITLLVTSALVALIGAQSVRFELDASAESLVLENDDDLRYYRSIGARYGSDDSLIITYTPKSPLFSRGSLADLRHLRDRLLELERVESVISILDVPLIRSPKVSLAEIRDHVRTLESADTDIDLARAELLGSPLFRNLIISPDGKTTAIQVFFRRDKTFYSLLKRRDALREKQLTKELSADELEELVVVSDEFKQYSAALLDRESEDIVVIRAIMDEHRGGAKLFLGGVTMIASDMIDFIRHDLVAFGLGVLCFLIAMLAISFRKLRWVFLPLCCCFAAVLFMFGYLGLVGWKVTVVSSNFISLLLIITLSLTIHLIVRYHELHVAAPNASQRTLVLETVRTKALPSLYTALTTMVAFGSLLLSHIRPVIDFGWMMAIGITVAFLLSFLLFPAGLMLLKPVQIESRWGFTGKLTSAFVTLIDKHGKATLLVFLVLITLSVIGISKLTVENRFIDHFKESTEIYRGMEMIDRELGGTTPLDVIVDADPAFYASVNEEQRQSAAVDEFEDAFEDDPGISETSYWYNSFRLNTIDAIHTYLDDLPETGKTLSLATTMRLFQQLNDDRPLDDFTLSIIHKTLPKSVKRSLLTPYMSEDGNQLRFAVRLFESDPSLRRNELLKKIRSHLVEQMGFSPDQIHLTGMVVLYNNMLQSLHRSQIQTLGVVFLVIMLMFVILFRSLKLAAVAIVPNLVAAGMVLGLMGWFNIPLDIMTITIAAITIGIAVDDTIHYVHRFIVEVDKNSDYMATVKQCHTSVGRAMYYTSITVIIGFSILALSSFKPTIYFGLLTGFAMTVALVANLTLLPLLLLWLKPTGSPQMSGAVRESA